MGKTILTDRDTRWVNECSRIQKYLLSLGLILALFLAFYLFTYLTNPDSLVKSICENTILLQAVIVFFVMGIWYLNYKYLGVIRVLMCKDVAE